MSRSIACNFGVRVGGGEIPEDPADIGETSPRPLQRADEMSKLGGDGSLAMRVDFGLVLGEGCFERRRGNARRSIALKGGRPKGPLQAIRRGLSMTVS